jgi:hypothetical protein
VLCFLRQSPERGGGKTKQSRVISMTARPGVIQADRGHAKPGRHDPQHPQIAKDRPQADRGSDYSSATP